MLLCLHFSIGVFFGDGSGRRWLISVEESVEPAQTVFETMTVDEGSHHDMRGWHMMDNSALMIQGTRNAGRQKSAASHRTSLYVMS